VQGPAGATVVVEVVAAGAVVLVGTGARLCEWVPDPEQAEMSMANRARSFRIPLILPVRSPVMTEIRGKTALVTGATGGLGRAIARALKDEGCAVVVTGRQAGPLDQVATELGGRAVVADLSRREDLDRMLQEAGPVDIAVMNAALPGSGQLQEWEQEEIDRVIEVNLANPIAMTRALLPGFLDRRRGHFVYISSLSGKVGSRGAPMYSATKFGLRGFAHTLHGDLLGTGVGCSVVNPGFVRDAGMFADSGTKLPPGTGTVSPEQVAAAVVRAVRRNRAEIDVAPVPLRLGAVFGSLVPGVAARFQSRFGDGVARQMVEGQRHKRV
jgi:short-subunit dehydrogenase